MTPSGLLSQGADNAIIHFQNTIRHQYHFIIFLPVSTNFILIPDKQILEFRLFKDSRHHQTHDYCYAGTVKLHCTVDGKNEEGLMQRARSRYEVPIISR